jgi:hypothetical protein
MLISFFGGTFLLILGLVIFGIYGVFGFEPFPETNELETGATFTPSPTVMTTLPSSEATITPTENPTTSVTPVNLENLETPTFTPEIPTETPEPSETPSPETPTVTSTPDIDTAVVNSPNGLWLRETPGGTQEVELIPDGTVLTVLAGREVVDGFEWQQVRTPAGNEGWVAVEFIVYQ